MYPLLIWIVLLGYQRGDEGRFLFIEWFQLIYEERMMELGYLHFYNPLWINLCTCANNQKKRQLDIRCLLIEEHVRTCVVVLLKKINKWKLTKFLNLTTNIKVEQRLVGHTEWHHKDAVNKIYIFGKHYKPNDPISLTNNLQEKELEREVEPIY